MNARQAMELALVELRKFERKQHAFGHEPSDPCSTRDAIDALAEQLAADES